MNSQEYIEVSMHITPFTEENAEILTAEISELPFESFTVEGEVLKCYIQKELYDAQALKVVMSGLDYPDFTVQYSANLMPAVNWNAVWESQFTPIVVDGKCTIKASFHEGLKKTRFNITIDPKMAFGTGHHQTTFMMCRALLQNEDAVRGKVVMDMGCGTAILSILAAYLGAEKVDAVDIDVWAYENSIDNLVVNKVEDKIHVRQGDAATVEGLNSVYDIFLANINRNILLNDIPRYANSIKENGKLILSGFYKEDIPAIEEVAKKHNFSLQTVKEKDNWVSICMNKQKC